MDVAIGLPNAVPGTTGKQLTEWARRAEARGFSSLGTIDRIAYPNYEPLSALAAAAAVTERIGLCTSVLLGPLHGNAVALAKQALSVHALSGERLTLGIGLGAREDDYELAGVDHSTRGEVLESMLPRMKELWEGDEMGPPTASPPALMVGVARVHEVDSTAVLLAAVTYRVALFISVPILYSLVRIQLRSRARLVAAMPDHAEAP